MDPWAIVNGTNVFLLWSFARKQLKWNQWYVENKSPDQLDEKVYTCVRKPSRSLWLAIRIFKVGFHMKKTVACMTGALWAKRGERDISCGAWHECEARDEGKGKIKLYLLSLYFSLSLVSRFALVSRSTRNIAFAPLGS